MSKVKVWISAFRLRTLPLALSAVLTGMSLADQHYHASAGITLLCLLTAVSLQVLSNLANDYGDFMKGTDNEKRLGNMRALQSGLVSPKAMLGMIIFFVLLSLGSGIGLLYKASAGHIDYKFWGFFVLGIAAIIAAIKYTVGKSAYGYTGFGDIFVFFFFGPVAVMGTFLLNSNFQFDLATDFSALLPAFGIGMLCTAVLTVNNIRDIENDHASGKRTIPVKLGLQRARNYHSVLVGLGLVLMLSYIFFSSFNLLRLILFIPAALIARNIVKVRRTEPSPEYNLYLKQLSVGTLLYALLFFMINFVIRLLFITSSVLHFSK